jgi:hypothetical protein
LYTCWFETLLAIYEYRLMTETRKAKRVMMMMIIMMMMMMVTIITISESLRKYLNNPPGKHEVKELQDTVCWTQQTYWGKW